MQVVVVTGEAGREALPDQDRVVEVDDLHVAGRRGADLLDQGARGAAVVARQPVVGPRGALVLGVAIFGFYLMAL